VIRPPTAVARRLQAAATRAPRVDLVEIVGADENFSKHTGELASVVERWLEEVLKRPACGDPRASWACVKRSGRGETRDRGQ
jgi:hypothetical protein